MDPEVLLFGAILNYLTWVEKFRIYVAMSVRKRD